ncbi:ribosomal protein S10 domain-containing protein, partial [Lentinula edodes]
SEEAYASALVHGRSIHLPYIHPRTHSIPAGNITFYSHHPRLLALFTHVASHAASSLAIPISKVIMLPTERSLWTVIRAPFAYKKSQENFERKTHKRMIKAWDADPEVIDRWVKYLEKHAMGGVGIRVTKWERLPIGIGKTLDAKLLEVQQEGDSDANRKQAIQALGEKILKEEL